MALWAIVSALTALSTNFTGLLLTRFFLGITEAPFYPGAVYILTVFYNRKEVATRIAILYTGNVLATAFAGLIAAGVFHGMDKVAGIAGWRVSALSSLANIVPRMRILDRGQCPNGCAGLTTFTLYSGFSSFRASLPSWSPLLASSASQTSR